MSVLRIVMALAACVSLGGCSDAVFACDGDSDCESGELGQCEANGFCSFPDVDCPSGRRYGEFAGDDLANECVSENEAGSTGTADDGDDSGVSLDGEASSVTMPPTSSGADDSTTDTPVTIDPADSSGDDDVDPTIVTDTTDPTTGSTDPTTDGDPSSETSGGQAEPMTMSFGERDDADVQGVTHDTFILVDQPTLNNGAHPDFHISGNADVGAQEVALLAFDLAELPDLPVVSAELRIWTYDVVGPGAIQVHRVIETWDEGDGDFSEGVCNWTDREPMTPWSSPGAGVGSFDDEVLAEFEATRQYVELVIELPAALIDTLHAADGNDSIMLRTTDHASMWFASSEEADTSLRPLLVVTLQP
jgi:hypothetical protein